MSDRNEISLKKIKDSIKKKDLEEARGSIQEETCKGCQLYMTYVSIKVAVEYCNKII